MGWVKDGFDSAGLNKLSIERLNWSIEGCLGGMGGLLSFTIFHPYSNFL
jgi:hypothetical protein